MDSGKKSGEFTNERKHVLAAVLVLSLLAGTVWAQVTASMTGTVRDATGAVVPEAAVTIKHLESGLARTAETDASGSYSVPSLPVGQYEMTAEKTGFKQQVRRGITLVVGQQAVVNMTLEVGNVAQQVTVTAEAPLVNTTLSSTSGLVNEKEVKDLPLNGRSFDQLLTLNVGTTNYTSNLGRRGNVFSVAGRRPEENRFLMNGVDYIGAESSSQNIEPSGASGQLLGVDAVREFNVVQHTYGAEYGKRAGGQISIVTSSGTNQLHGSAFEYLRNSLLDARNFFDPPLETRVPPFKRNQFGGALGGPLKKDKLFLFGNYEGFRQRLGISSVAIVPDALARQGSLPIGPNNSRIPVPNLKTGMLPFFSFWPEPNGPELGGGLARRISNPLQKIREDFGLVRFDYNVSAKDSFSANYVIDDGGSDTPTANPNFLQLAPQSGQLLSLQQTHIFSPTVLNVATLGFNRGHAVSQTVPTVPIPANLLFITGTTPGAITIGGGITTTVASAITPAGGSPGSGSVRNIFTGADDVNYVKGSHSFRAGLWIQRIQHNYGGPSIANAGAVSYPTLLAFLQDAPTQFIGVPNPVPAGYRSTEAAWYVQDEIKLRPNLTLRLGLRDEMTTGWNEVTGRASNYLFDSNGVILTDPLVGPSPLVENNAIALWQPRVGLAWDPTGTGTWAVRAGFGIYNSLQDNLGFRASGNPPFYSRITLTVPLLSFIPIPGGTQPPPSCSPTQGQPCSLFSPAGLDPNMRTPTVQQWSFTVERELTSNLMLQLGYVGSQAYHVQISINKNVSHPQVCSDPQGCASGGVRPLAQQGRVPQGTTYMPPGPRPNPFVGGTYSWFFEGNSSYHALNVSLVKRASHGLTFKTNYTFSKALDLNSATTSAMGTNQPQSILNPYDLNLSKGIAAFSLQHQFNTNFSYELPLGRGQRWGSGSSGVVDKLIGGWQWNGILTAQSGFPFTPQVGTNISGTGDTFNPDVPNRNPAFSGPVILGKPGQYYDPNAFLLPTPGTFGDAGRGTFVGPGLFTLDTSLFKKFSLNERWSLRFQAEAFNILNHANFAIPNRVVFSGNNINPSAGVITSTSTTSRQLQFALKLLF